MTSKRSDGRAPLELRKLAIYAGLNPFAMGSSQVTLGSTQILTSAKIKKALSTSISGISTRINLLAQSTPGDLPFSQEEIENIELLCNKALTAAVATCDLRDLTCEIECYVSCADGGLACAIIAGAWVSLYQCLNWASIENLISEPVKVVRMAAITVGMVNNQILVDLNAEELAKAQYSAVALFDSQQQLLSFQSTKTSSPVPVATMQNLIQSAAGAVTEIFREEEKAVTEESL
jgi:ribonuclease PH